MSALYFSEVVEAIKDNFAILVADLTTGEIVFATRPLEEMFGYSVRGDLLGKSVDILVPDAVREQHASHRATYATEPHNRPLGGQLPLRGQRKDGSMFPVDIMLTPSLIGSRKCVIATVLDMSARHAATTPIAGAREGT